VCRNKVTIAGAVSMEVWKSRRLGGLSPARRRLAVDHVRAALGCSERRACKTIGQQRSTQRKPKVIRDNEAALTADIIRLASEYCRYGYRRVTALLRRDGWAVNSNLGLPAPKHRATHTLWITASSAVMSEEVRPHTRHHPPSLQG